MWLHAVELYESLSPWPHPEVVVAWALNMTPAEA